MNAFDGSPTETMRSFWAGAICWPMFFALGLITGVNEGMGAIGERESGTSGGMSVSWARRSR